MAVDEQDAVHDRWSVILPWVAMALSLSFILVRRLIRYRQNAGKVKLSDIERGDPSSHPSLPGDGDDDDDDDDDDQDQLPIDDFYHDQADEDAIPLMLSPPTKQVPLPPLGLDEEGVRAGGARTTEGAAQTTTLVEEEVGSGSDRARP